MFCDHLNVGMTRRDFFGRFALGLGGMALSQLLPRSIAATVGGVLPQTHFPARAKRIIYLFMAGGPSQLDLFDYKPLLNQRNGEDLPESVRMGQRLTGMSANQSALPMAGSHFKFAQHGSTGAWMSDLLPWTSKITDELCFIRSMHTPHINHDPAITFFQTGHQLPGRPSMGSWLSYGLGSENRDLPGFVVLTSRGSAVSPADPLFARLWGSGFLPSNHQGVSFRSSGDPVLYLSNPDGVTGADRRRMLTTLATLNAQQRAETLDPEIDTRIAQYEMAYRMQTSVPELTDVSDEPQHTFDLYGPDAKKPGTFAANCLLARRLAERGVRFIQLFHRGWDQHSSLPKQLPGQCSDTDQPSAALVQDLKQRGLLDDTLIV